MSHFDWTDERIEQLKKLWAEGLSSRDIACRLGNDSRSSVIGKLHRLGLSDAMRGKPAPVRTPRVSRPRPVPTYRKVPVAARPVTSAPPIVPDTEQPVINDEIEVPVEQRLALLDLERNDCRWPIGHPDRDGFGFCGQEQAPGLSYCVAHARRAYRASDPVRPAPAPTERPANDNAVSVENRELVDA